MAHIVVYLQRTARGLHPGSLVALCAARDMADARGASVLSLCLGDAGAYDDGTIVEASRSGTDQLVFLGPEAIPKLFRRLAPRAVFAPFTREAASVLAHAELPAMVPVHVEGHLSQKFSPDTVIGVVAGALPWHEAPLQIEPEYEADVTQVELAPWLREASESAAPPQTEPPPIFYVAPEGLDSDTEAALQALGATPQDAADLGFNQPDSPRRATILWFASDAPSLSLPEQLHDRGPGVRLLVLIAERAPDGGVDPSWETADLVLVGPHAETVGEFSKLAWKTMFA